MANCCHSECTAGLPSKRHICPVNGQEYKSVTQRKILHHIKSPWEWTEKQQGQELAVLRRSVPLPHKIQNGLYLNA